MVKNTSNTTIGISILAAFGLLLFVLYKLQPPKYDWKETYNKDIKEQPYATGMLYELLQDYFPEQAFTSVKKSIVDEVVVDGEKATNYLFIGNQFYLNPEESDHLLNYVKEGNRIFISAKDFPESFIQELYQTDCSAFSANSEDKSLTAGELENLFKEHVINSDSLDVVFKELDEWEENPPTEFTDENDIQEETEDDFTEESFNEDFPYGQGAFLSFWEGVESYSDSAAMFNFSHPDFKRSSSYTYQHQIKDKTSYRNWSYFSKDILCEEGIDYSTLGYLVPQRLNFIRIPHGDGFVFLHSEPFLFSNFHIKEASGIEYTSKVFSHLPEGDIYWDAKSHKYAKLLAENGPSKSSLAFILSQKSLRWAWYLLLTMGLLYILFRAKRQQQIIPVLPENKNSSLEFIKTVGRLYFLQNDHRKLAQRKMQLFLAYVREHYLIPTHQVDQAMKERLAIKSEVPLSVIEEIFLRFQRLDRASEISTSHLVNFHQVIERFYATSK